MQTRQALYEAHEFRETWIEVTKDIKLMEIFPDATPDHQQNVLRLKKVIAYVDGLLSIADKDLIPLSIWQNFTKPSTQILNDIQQYHSTTDEALIDSANQQMDLLIEYLVPYIPTGHAAVEAFG